MSRWRDLPLGALQPAARLGGSHPYFERLPQHDRSVALVTADAMRGDRVDSQRQRFW